MHFIWPSQRYDRLSKKTTTVAALATALLTIAVLLPAVRVYNVARRRPPLPVVRREIVIFVAPAAREPLSVGPANVSQLASRPSLRTATTRASIRDTSSVAASRVEPVTLYEETSVPRDASIAAGTNANRIGPVLAPVAASQLVILSDAARDSLNRLMSAVWDFRKPLPPTATQRDSAAREMARRAALAREEHRPMAVPLGAGSLPFAFLSRGPSHEQRARDSVINADNVQRLARLAERVRKKRDSLLAANTLARAPKGLVEPRPDSMQPRKPVPRR